MNENTARSVPSCHQFPHSPSWHFNFSQCGGSVIFRHADRGPRTQHGKQRKALNSRPNHPGCPCHPSQPQSPQSIRAIFAIPRCAITFRRVPWLLHLVFHWFSSECAELGRRTKPPTRLRDVLHRRPQGFLVACRILLFKM